MKSSFWHIGINKTIEMKHHHDLKWLAPRIKSNCSIEYKPLRLKEDGKIHRDPDFRRLTYGEAQNKSRLFNPHAGDIAFFIETAPDDEKLEEVVLLSRGIFRN